MEARKSIRSADLPDLVTITIVDEAGTAQTTIRTNNPGWAVEQWARNRPPQRWRVRVDDLVTIAVVDQDGVVGTSIRTNNPAWAFEQWTRNRPNRGWSWRLAAA